LKQKDVRRLKTAEMKFIRRIAGYNLLDHRRNNIVKKKNTDAVERKLSQYNKNG
jgi:hypothetical protein